MKISIDDALECLEGSCTHCKLKECISAETDELSIDIMRKYKTMLIDYNARLKSDMVDILEDLDLDTQELTLAGVIDNRELVFCDEVNALIHEKINALKGGEV